MNLLQELKALREKATQGEWIADNPKLRSYNTDTLSSIGIDGRLGEIVGTDYETGDGMSSHDANYIVAMHNALPALISQLEAAERLAEAFESASFSIEIKMNKALANYKQSKQV